MTVDPFIEAEEAAGHSVHNACHLLEVSRSAYYERRNGAPSPRSVTDAELTAKITAIHAESKGTYGSPRVHKELGHRGVVCGRRRVTRLMRIAGLEGRQEALEEDDGCRPRRRGGQGPHPAPLRTV